MVEFSESSQAAGAKRLIAITAAALLHLLLKKALLEASVAPCLHWEFFQQQPNGSPPPGVESSVEI